MKKPPGGRKKSPFPAEKFIRKISGSGFSRIKGGILEYLISAGNSGHVSFRTSKEETKYFLLFSLQSRAKTFWRVS
jgi:hypothetical protein